MKALATGGVAAAAACLATSTLLAAGGMQITTKTTNNGKTYTTTIQLDANHFRVASDGMRNGQQLLIFDGLKQLMDIVDLDRKTYSEVTKQDMDRLASQVSDMASRMSQAMGNLTPAQRAQMEAMMRGRMSQAPTPVKTEYRKTGSDAVGAWQCDKYEGYKGTRKVEELCTVDASALGFTSTDFNVTHELTDFAGKLAPQRQAIFAVGSMDPEGVTGIPVRSIEYDSAGNVQSETLLTGVTRQSLPDSTFAVPAGFQKQPFASMGGGR